MVSTCILAVDGRSGSGKTAFATELAEALGARVLHVEDFYPGWVGLRAGADWLVEGVLEPLSRGEEVSLRRWDWSADRFEDGGTFAPGGVVVVEGCGALSVRSHPYIHVGIWLDADERVRRVRATARDGGDAWWAGWAAQEDAFYAEEGSREYAAVIGIDSDLGTALDGGAAPDPGLAPDNG